MQIAVADLTKTYGSRRVVDRLSFTRGGPGVTGLLGANGSGKSTTLRMMLGLSTPDHGSATFDGTPFVALPNPGAAVGVMLDAQANHRGRTGLEILRLAARTVGVSDHRVSEVLDQVGLAYAARNRFGGYSLGMKQRLGLAQALLAEPGVLILDEPANGLDPEGILWLRDLLRSYADRGGLVLLSSHQLSEVELLVDSVIMIGHGRVIVDAGLPELVGRSRVRVSAGDGAALRIALGSAGLAFFPVDGSPGFDVDATAEQIGSLALAHHLVLHELRPSPADSLETTFFRLTEPAGATHVA